MRLDPRALTPRGRGEDRMRAVREIAIAKGDMCRHKDQISAMPLRATGHHALRAFTLQAQELQA